jgi:hypothetical protein
MEPEYRGALWGVVCADALEDACAIVEGVGEEMDIGVIPGDELAIAPDV